MSTLPPEDASGRSAEKDAAFVQLSADLWVDLDAGIVIRAQQHIFLTARETHVLRILVQSLRNGRGYISAQAIAERIRLLDPNNTEHAIEQTISSIRQKFGETAFHPRILQGRRGFGYRLFPDVPQKK